MKLGCSTILYGKLPLATALGGISKAGFSAIELCALPGMAPHVDTSLSADEREAVKQQVADYGLAIESLGASGRMNLAEPQGFKDTLQLAADLGAPAVTCGAGGKFGDEESYATFVKVVTEEFIPVAKDLGLTISFKPHVGNSVCNRETCQRFVNDVDTTWVGINIDPSHLWRTDPNLDPGETVKLLGNWVKTGRIRDTREHDQPVGPPEKQVPGGGWMRLSELIAAYKEATSLEYLTVEIVGAHTWLDAFRVQKVVEACAYVLKPMVEE